MTWQQLKLDLAPSNLRSETRRLVAKYGRKLRGDDGKVVRLPAEGERRGAVLLSYIIDPFLLEDPARIPYSHTHFWESYTIARTWASLGFDVDCVSWTNHAFVPAQDYQVLIDVRRNLERWAPLLPKALKVLHADTAHYSFHNPAQERRYADLARRRGAALSGHKRLPENRAAEVADAIVVLGNRFTQATYAFAGKPILHVPVSVPFTYAWTEGKDFAAVRRRYLWFGSGGLVHKGLDLVLEAFAGLPGHELVVCGPIRRERDFERAYFRELYETPNIRTLGWVDVAPSAFLALARTCLGLVYPSCSEGGGSSVYTCMHAGLLPLVNFEVSVDVAPEFGVLLPAVDPETLQAAVAGLSAKEPAALEAMARAARDQARRVSSKDLFAAAYRRAAKTLASGLPSADRSQP